MDNKLSYSATHPHPDHINIPPRAIPDKALEGGTNPSPDVDMPPAADDDASHLTPSGDRPAPARGILKNPIRGSEGSRAEHLQWDEANIALTEIQKDSLMKIDEPKTPYVRYDAENDVVLGIGEVPDFDLGDGNTPLSPTALTSSPANSTRELTDTNTESNARRPSIGASSGSSRSASFSLPDKPHPVRPGHPSSPTQSISAQVGATYANTAANTASSVSGSDVFADSDEEAMDEEAKAHKRDFEKKRAMHYGQEAALALQRAKEMAEDEEEEDANATPPPMPNGSNGGL